jgi:glutamate synthase (NADPH) small chain
MHRIVEKRELSPKTYLMRIQAPLIARKRRAGQFVIVMAEPTGERVPLTLVDSDPDAGTITLVFQAVGKSTMKLASLEVGDRIPQIAGPLGRPTHIEKVGTVVVIGGGYGIAPVVPIARALAEIGNEVIAINGARTAEAVILVDELKKFCSRVEICTDDGTAGFHGLVTDCFQGLLDEGLQVDEVVAIGPVPMMRAVAELTRPLGIPTVVSLNPIMIDGTGMCGGCRVEVGGETKFACVDGPEFDGHLVNFPLLAARQRVYRDLESESREQYEHACQLDEQTGAVECSEPDRIPRQPMPEQDPRARATNFNEVALGYSARTARLEASRCLQCKNPQCVKGCPVGVDIPGFLKHIAEGQFDQAAARLKETNALPAICGRVCPQETQCEARCVLGRKHEPVAVGRLERFAADYEREHGAISLPRQSTPTGKRVAVVGSGPAGLTCAAELAKLGHQVVVLEALHELGGVLAYGIPEFRLPKAIVREEIAYLHNLGVEFRTSVVVGKTVTLEELRHEYDAVFVGAGAGLPKFLGVPGENLLGVVSANEYLTRANLMRAYDWPRHDTPILRGKRVITVGGGNVAMDSARTAKRFGAEASIIVYRRTLEEMPARQEEVHHAQEEGIEFMLLHNPIEFLGDDQMRLRAAVLQRMQLGEPDESGRLGPEPVPGSEIEIPVDIAIIAIGTAPNPLIAADCDVTMNRHGCIVTDPETGATSLPGVYAGGDISTGAATVIEAMGAGQRAARAIHNFLRQPAGRVKRRVGPPL